MGVIPKRPGSKLGEVAGQEVTAEHTEAAGAVVVAVDVGIDVEARRRHLGGVAGSFFMIRSQNSEAEVMSPGRRQPVAFCNF